jgi:SAM-dependent methyltransferase
MDISANIKLDSFCLPKEEIDRLISPYVNEKLTITNLAVSKTMLFEYCRWLVRRSMAKWNRYRIGLRRTPEYVNKSYDIFWNDFEWKSLDPLQGRKTLMKWDGYYFWGNPMGIGRIQLHCLNRLIESFQPRRVLEVGCGLGLKLIALSRRFPNIEFHGVELTNSGTEGARIIQAMKTLPDEFINYVPFEIRTQGVVDNLTFHQGSAASMSFPKDSFDFVFTNQSIEQMQVISDKVFKEIRRVSGGKVAFIEPFYDFNANGVCRNRIIARDYFSGKISDLHKYGYNVMFVHRDFPSKFYMNVGLVVAE